MLQLAPSTVSKHLFILRNARLIIGRKEGRWMYYRLNSDGAPAVAADALAWVIRSLADDPVIREDTARLNRLLAEPAESRCG
jgi:DNA-binding transcriptional ArsR family regulator